MPATSSPGASLRRWRPTLTFFSKELDDDHVHSTIGRVMSRCLLTLEEATRRHL